MLYRIKSFLTKLNICYRCRPCKLLLSDRPHLSMWYTYVRSIVLKSLFISTVEYFLTSVLCAPNVLFLILLGNRPDETVKRYYKCIVFNCYILQLDNVFGKRYLSRYFFKYQLIIIIFAYKIQ